MGDFACLVKLLINSLSAHKHTIFPGFICTVCACTLIMLTCQFGKCDICFSLYSRKLQKSEEDNNKLKYMSGEWFYEAKSQRHRDKIHGADIIRASMRKKKPVTLCKCRTAHTKHFTSANATLLWGNCWRSDSRASCLFLFSFLNLSFSSKPSFFSRNQHSAAWISFDISPFTVINVGYEN